MTGHCCESCGNGEVCDCYKDSEAVPQPEEEELVSYLAPAPQCGDHWGRPAATWRVAFDFLFSGMVIACAYVDPGNLESDFQAGGRFGLELLWVLIWVTVAGCWVQSLAVRLGLGSGIDLARACREEYPFPIRFMLWFTSEISIICCDIPEVLGAALGLKILTGWSTLPCIFITGIVSVLLLQVQMLGLRYFEGLVTALLALVAASFFVEWSASNVPLSETIYHSVVPRISSMESLYIAISLIGSVIMPHNLYLSSAVSLFRRPPPEAAQRTRATKKVFKFQMLGTGAALAVSVLMNMACVAVAYATSLKVSPSDRESLAESPLLNAPRMLSSTLGAYAGVLFAVSLIASGQSATLTGTLAGQFVMEGFWHWRVSATVRASIARLVSLVPAVLVSLIWGDKGSEGLILFSSVVLAFQLPFALIPLIKFVSSPRYVSRGMLLDRWSRTFAWVLSLAFVVSNLFLVSVMLRNGALPAYDGSIRAKATWFAILIFCVAYVSALIGLIARPVMGSSPEFRCQLPEAAAGGQQATGHAHDSRWYGGHSHNSHGGGNGVRQQATAASGGAGGESEARSAALPLQQPLLEAAD